jgi:MFS family permease
MNEGKLTRGQWLVLAAAFLGWMFDGVEIGLFPLVGRPALQDLLGITDDKTIAVYFSSIIACFLVGAAIGGVSLGWLGDKIGRVRGLVICMLMYSVFTGACYFAPIGPLGAVWLGACIFMAALGMGGEWSLAVALVMECWPERHRSKLAGIIGAACNVGLLFIAVVALTRQVTVSDWRWMMLVGASPAILALLIIFFVPESERWKAAAKKGGRSPIIAIFAPGIRSKTLLAMVLSGVPLIGTWGAVSGYIPAWAEQLKQAQVAKALLPAENAAQLKSGMTRDQQSALVKELLPKENWDKVRGDASRAKALSQIVMGLGAIIACIAASIIGGMFGRRPVYFALCLLSLFSCAYFFRYLTEFDTWFLFIAFVVGGITASFYGWLPLYLPELFPTRIRATGQGLSFNFGRILAAIGTLCMGGFVGLFGGDYGRAMGAITLIYIVGMVVVWFAPETKGKPLPD